MASFRRCLLLAGLAWPLAVWAGPVATGQLLPPLALKDQHDQAWSVGPDTRQVLLATDRAAASLVQSVLGMQPAGFLASRQAVYQPDMSRMPGFVTRSFALPALRQQPFRLGVVLDGRILEGWPRPQAGLSLITLSQGRVERLDTLNTETELRSALGL